MAVFKLGPYNKVTFTKIIKQFKFIQDIKPPSTDVKYLIKF